MGGRVVVDYHDRTKHHFHRFARSLEHLDWASQPDPFRRYAGARTIPLSRRPLAIDVPFDRLYDPSTPAPLTVEALSEFLRCSLGLSAWKQYGTTRWALRVNPSSGNLHPTEGYVVTGLRLAHDDESAVRVCHYAPELHALEERTTLRDSASTSGADWSTTFLVGLTSIPWREAWKYGERAFRYCQHDTGHAIAAMRFAAALFGWRLALLPHWPEADVAALLGIGGSGGSEDAPHEDPHQDGAGGGTETDGPEREWPECLAIVTCGGGDAAIECDPSTMMEVRSATWHGVPNRLSTTRVEWPIIDEVAKATEYTGRSATSRAVFTPTGHRDAETQRLEEEIFRTPGGDEAPSTHQAPSTKHQALTLARSVILQRRSAVAFDGQGVLPRAAFVAMLQRLMPGGPPWDAIWWTPHVHLMLFVHRIEGLLPGIYAFVREEAAADALRASCREDFLWEAVPDADGLFLLAPFDCRSIARRLSCDQDIAADGFFGMAMLARFEEPLRQRGEWFYRNLFWEAGMIGQVLYLEAEAAGTRATGIGCYYDDPVHDLLGLSGRRWQSLYHFSMGMPVEDGRLTTEPGYPWE